MTPVRYRLLFVSMTFLLLSGISSLSHAGGYLGIDGSSLTVTNSVDDDINPRGLRLRLGMRVNQHFDLEAHVGGGTDSDVRAFDEFSTTYAGMYLKGYLPIGQRSALFALVGGTAVELTQSIGRGRFSDDRGGFSFGFGLETQLSHTLDLSADFMRYALDDEEFSEVSAVNFGLKWYF